jgi:hypothetical protein
MTPRDQAFAIIRRAAHVTGCAPEDVLGKTRTPAADLARIKAYRALDDEHQWGPARIARFFGRTHSTVVQALASARARGVALRDPVRVTASERMADRLDDLEHFVRRITGQQLVYQLRDRLQLRMWQALPLAILVEAHPRVMTTEALCEAYEAAAADLRFGKGKPIETVMLKTAWLQVRKRFDALGLTDPVTSVKPHGYRATDEFALWVETNCTRAETWPLRL